MENSTFLFFWWKCGLALVLLDEGLTHEPLQVQHQRTDGGTWRTMVISDGRNWALNAIGWKIQQKALNVDHGIERMKSLMKSPSVKYHAGWCSSNIWVWSFCRARLTLKGQLSKAESGKSSRCSDTGLISAPRGIKRTSYLDSVYLPGFSEDLQKGTGNLRKWCQIPY